MKILFCEDISFLEEMAMFQLKMAQETEGMQLDFEIVSKGIKSVIDDASKGRYLIAMEDTKLVGMLMIVPEWSDWRCSTVYWIHSVYIKPNYRGRGIYKKMYLFLKQLVEEREDLAGLRLYVDRTNTNAQKVYEKLEMSKEHYYLYEWLK